MLWVARVASPPCPRSSIVKGELSVVMWLKQGFPGDVLIDEGETWTLST